MTCILLVVRVFPVRDGGFFKMCYIVVHERREDKPGTTAHTDTAPTGNVCDNCCNDS